MTSPLKTGEQEKNMHTIAVNPKQSGATFQQPQSDCHHIHTKPLSPVCPSFKQNEMDVLAATGCFQPSRLLVVPKEILLDLSTRKNLSKKS